ncbi:nucleotidyltransferase family protein [Brucella sp. NM4]|uniref:nucleotidyltransferase family protein n=1 Tax=Brucella sp. NM4 TaxID=3045175 RepID=UPI0024BC550C|nr:nucleotidyltransferase family protein [Brucella sp. NM4]WHS33892.1 nucleotidyltransferase family protein [Brucella sp. NM4]
MDPVVEHIEQGAGRQTTTALIVLGAGLSSRFGEKDKLAARLGGIPLAHHILPALQPFSWSSKILVCRRQSSWVEAFSDDGYSIIRNDQPNQGMLGSLKMAVDQLTEKRLAMICLADMPFVTREHIERLLLLAHSSNGQPVASRAEEYRGPPAIFPVAALRQLRGFGEGGARSLLTNALFVDCPPSQLLDVDTTTALKIAENIKKISGDDTN